LNIGESIIVYGETWLIKAKQLPAGLYKVYLERKYKEVIMPKSVKRRTVELDPDVHKELRKKAAEKDIFLRDLVNQALRKQFKIKKPE